MVSCPARFPEIHDELRKILDANMDEAPARRRAREAFKEIQLGLDHLLFKTPYDGLEMKERYEEKLFLKFFIPLIDESKRFWNPATIRCSFDLQQFVNEHITTGLYIVYIVLQGKLKRIGNFLETTSPKALVCFCHAFGETCTFFFEGIARKLALSGYGVFAVDYPGFGLSEGLHGYIPNMDSLVDDVIEHYSNVKESPEFRTLPSFLFGQSMGGGIALKIHFEQPNAWTGAILQAPLCKISGDNMVPPWLVTQMLIGVGKIFPTRKLVPQKHLAEEAYRELKKRQMAVVYNVLCYKGKLRLKTGVEILRATQEIERRMEEVSIPLLILQGEADKFTDPSGAKSWYEKATSSDKTLKLYKGGYHFLLEGEPDEIITQVFNDTISWLDEHSK